MNERIKDLAILCATQLDWDLPSDPTNYTFSSTGLEKFAELVVAAEREAVAAAEREACAKLVWATPEPDDVIVSHREAIVKAIRARGNK